MDSHHKFTEFEYFHHLKSHFEFLDFWQIHFLPRNCWTSLNLFIRTLGSPLTSGDSIDLRTPAVKDNSCHHIDRNQIRANMRFKSLGMALLWSVDSISSCFFESSFGFSELIYCCLNLISYLACFAAMCSELELLGDAAEACQHLIHVGLIR